MLTFVNTGLFWGMFENFIIEEHDNDGMLMQF